MKRCIQKGFSGVIVLALLWMSMMVCLYFSNYVNLFELYTQYRAKHLKQQALTDKLVQLPLALCKENWDLMQQQFQKGFTQHEAKFQYNEREDYYIDGAFSIAQQRVSVHTKIYTRRAVLMELTHILDKQGDVISVREYEDT